MQVDFSVELGVDDERMELPWASPDGEVRYYDLKRNPELLLNVAEAFDNQELGQFLASANSAGSILETIKCDSWFGEEITEEEKIFGEPCKFGSYVDLIFHQLEPRASLTAHEELAREACELLKRVPPISCAAEFTIRHCYFHEPGRADSKQGFGITFYLFGYGANQEESRARWNIGMKLVENALLQISASRRRAQSAG
jgi:hypothetical protein